MWQVRKAEDATSERPEADRRLESGDAGALGEDLARTELKVQLHKRLLDVINLSALETMSREQIGAEVGDIIAEELNSQRHALNQSDQALGDQHDDREQKHQHECTDPQVAHRSKLVSGRNRSAGTGDPRAAN